MENNNTINAINASISTLPLLLTVNQLAECLCMQRLSSLWMSTAT